MAPLTASPIEWATPLPPTPYPLVRSLHPSSLSEATSRPTMDGGFAAIGRRA